MREQFERIDASLARSAEERKAKADKLLKKALFGGRKRPVLRAYPKKLPASTPSESAGALQIEPIPAHNKHVTIINTHSKALGSKSETARATRDAREKDIAKQAERKRIPLAEYKVALPDMEQALRSLEPHQMYNLQVQKYLQDKLGPVEVPEQYKTFPAIEIQEEQQEKQQLRHDQQITTYEKASKSFQRLFCVQCVTFDCQFHASDRLGEHVRHQDVDTEAAIAIQYDKDRANIIWRAAADGAAKHTTCSSLP